MKDNRAPNYGIDAPLAVRNLFIVAALGVISLTARLAGVWSRQDPIAVIARPLMLAGMAVLEANLSKGRGAAAAHELAGLWQ